MTKAQDFGAGNPVKGGTIYLTTADEDGMMVSFIQSNYMGFGSGCVEPEFGISLQNRGHGFSLQPGINQVAPGKRPFHTIIPAFLSKDGQPVMSYGVMGANMQPQGHMQTLVRMLDYKQNPQAACDAPRWRFNAGLEINVEAAMNPATVQGLSDRGHRMEVINDSYQDFGAGQFIWRAGDPAVQGYVALTLSRVAPSDPVRAWVEEIRKAGDRAANLTRQLLAFSRQQVLRPQALDLGRELGEFRRLLAPLLGERIRLVVETEPGLGFVWADVSAINQIVMNLALNARDAMPDGGDLEIRCRLLHDTPGGTLRDAGFVELSVRDTGIGMDESTLARAFEPFFTTKEPGKGSGLGLAQVYGLVEQCGGTVEVESQPGRGAYFRVLLPRIEAAEVAAPAAPLSAQGGRGERLLLVEDEPMVRKLLEQLLSRVGFQVSSASTPAEAMLLLDRDRPFEAIVSDVVMAGMSGPEFAARVEVECGPVPTIFMSGHTEDEAIRSGAFKPHQRFMQKPFAPSELLVRLRELLDERGRSGARI